MFFTSRRAGRVSNSMSHIVLRGRSCHVVLNAHALAEISASVTDDSKA